MGFIETMKYITVTLSLAAMALFAVPSTLFAEDQPAATPPAHPEGAGRPGGEHRNTMNPEARLKYMTEKLGLDADQQAKAKAIYEKNAPKFKELLAKGRENLTAADKTALSELMKSQFEEFKALLTPAQLEKLKATRPAARGEEHGGAKPKPAAE